VGEKQNQSFQLLFNPSLKVDFQGSRVTSDSGLLLVRELDERLGLSALIAENIRDGRRGKNTQLPFPDLLRQSIYSRLAGYEDVNDAERLSQDPTFRLIGSEKIWERGAALPSRLHCLLQQARDGGAVDQGRQAGGEDDPPFLSSFSVEPSAAGAEPVGLQSGEFVAASGFAERD